MLIIPRPDGTGRRSGGVVYPYLLDAGASGEEGKPSRPWEEMSPERLQRCITSKTSPFPPGPQLSSTRARIKVVVRIGDAEVAVR